MSSATAREGAHVVEMQRRRLLLAIGELLAEGGVEAATVGRISRRAGVSRRTFYEVFDDREECFIAAFDREIEFISEHIAPEYTSERGWNARIRGGLTALLEYFDGHPSVARMCLIETLRAGPEILERRARVQVALTAVVEGGGETKASGDTLPLTAEGVVGGVASVLQARISACLSPKDGIRSRGHTDLRLVELVNPLMAMIVQPYLGPAAARRELERPTPETGATVTNTSHEPFRGLSIRFTYRTARVLATIGADTGANNRQIADSSGIGDEGQMSRLLRRLQQAGLIENRGEGRAKGEPNAWCLTDRGASINATLADRRETSTQARAATTA